MESPSRADGSVSFMMSFLYNMQSGSNGGLGGPSQAIKLMRVGLGVILEMKLTEGVYMHWSSGYPSEQPMQQVLSKGSDGACVMTPTTSLLLPKFLQGGWGGGGFKKYWWEY
jgi:hypothetical protein